jgi:DHA1 family bicyclomycin/chloramphenicol resistance-like MFS transporter
MLTFGAMFCFISSAPILLISIMGLTPATFGFGFGAVVLGYMIGGVISSRLIGRLSPVQMILSGILVVFSGAILGLICNQIGFDRLEILCASMFIVYFGAAMIMPSSAVEALQAFPRMAGFASSVVGCSQFAFAALVASVLGSIHMQHTLPFYLFIMGLASALCLVFVLHFRKLLHAQKAEEKNMRAAE